MPALRKEYPTDGMGKALPSPSAVFKIVSVIAGQHVTNRNHFGFGSSGEKSPFAARRRVENLSGFLLFGSGKAAKPLAQQYATRATRARRCETMTGSAGPNVIFTVGGTLRAVRGKPNRKRVEAYSAAMTPAQGVCVGQSWRCHVRGLQRVPLMTDASETRTLFLRDWVSFAREPLKPDMKKGHS